MFDPIKRARDSYARQNFLRFLGTELESLEPGRCTITLAIRPELTQQHGFAHAGVITTLADTAAGYAAYSTMPENASVLTVEFKVNLIKPAMGQALRAEANTIKAGRTLSVVEANVFAIDGGNEALAARMQATMMCLAGKADDPSISQRQETERKN
ncbi:PaaI family thioesterase [Oricola thermophila]|uniref:Medium/long-chain acyl-CoA thioesterase YigI n=1 Tax=Oricola thermophila TaxID=2742145 RepID=A0A6N1VBJ0_9HYPH|nr:PaaI family thioesterase [Oricola thermophila]QKV18274.1 PaaI family thioesterase [Oricola thermophila]